MKEEGVQPELVTRYLHAQGTYFTVSLLFAMRSVVPDALFRLAAVPVHMY